MIVDVRVAEADQQLRPFVELFEVVGRKLNVAVPSKPEPADVFLDRFDELSVLGGGIGVVEAEKAVSTELGCEPEVQEQRLRVPDMRVAVRFRWEAGHDLPAIEPGLLVPAHLFTNEIGRGGCNGHRVEVRHGPGSESGQ